MSDNEAVKTYSCKTQFHSGEVTAANPSQAAHKFATEKGWSQDMCPLIDHSVVEVTNIGSGQKWRFFVECEVKHEWYVRYEMPTTPQKWRSIAVWPDTIKVGNIVGKNESDDTHDSREAAQAVCDLLRRHGFGGDGKVFPISTRVEPVWE